MSRRALRERLGLVAKTSAQVIPLVIKTVVNDQPLVPVFVPPRRKEPSVDLIASEVARFYDLELIDILSDRHTKKESFARHVAIYLCLKLTSLDLRAIGHSFYRDDSTVRFVREKIGRALKEEKLAGDTSLEMDLKEIRAAIEEKFSGQ
jgi:chromosomal replication initiation ATPase DnaA